MTFIPLAVLTFAASVVVAPSTMPPVQVAHEPTITSEIFVARATMAGLYEVEAGKLALTRSKSPAVRDFAQRMVTEHNAAGVDLSRIVAGKTYALPNPLLLDSDHQAKLKALQKATDRNFDADYGKSMREGHDEVVNVFALASAETLVDADLRAYASKTLPTLRTHQALASTLPARD